MGLPEAKAAWNTLKAEIAALPNDYRKLNIILEVLDVATKAKDAVRAAIKDDPATNISQLPEYRIVDEFGNMYKINTNNGALTKI